MFRNKLKSVRKYEEMRLKCLIGTQKLLSVSKDRQKTEMVARHISGLALK